MRAHTRKRLAACLIIWRLLTIKWTKYMTGITGIWANEWYFDAIGSACDSLWRIRDCESDWQMIRNRWVCGMSAVEDTTKCIVVAYNANQIKQWLLYCSQYDRVRRQNISFVRNYLRWTREMSSGCISATYNDYKDAADIAVVVFVVIRFATQRCRALKSKSMSK